jgi:hypothetical protein
MITATKTLQFVRLIEGVGGVFADDPPISTPALAALAAWATTGRVAHVAVWFAAINGGGLRVPGLTATIGGYFYTPGADFGLPDVPEMWHDADTRAAQSLDRPAVFDVSYIHKMGVRLSTIVDASATAVAIRISVQEMPR